MQTFFCASSDKEVFYSHGEVREVHKIPAVTQKRESFQLYTEGIFVVL